MIASMHILAIILFISCPDPAGESPSVETVVSSCGVVVLPCGRRLLGGAALETPTLSWKRDGVELTSSSDGEVSTVLCKKLTY